MNLAWKSVKRVPDLLALRVKRLGRVLQNLNV